MSPVGRRTGVTGRVIRPADSPPVDRDWEDATPDERIEAVWQLTRLCMAWQWESPDEPRLQRSVVHIQRARR